MFTFIARPDGNFSLIHIGSDNPLESFAEEMQLNV